jgi:pSer/pThr/pTyr-binding forkhead associated (FHA) protein
MGKLVVSLDGVVIKEVQITKDKTTLGRRPYNDIVIDNLAVSGEHAVLQMVGADVFIEDLNSTNGTYINGQAVKKQLLSHNDTVEIGKYKIKFIVDDGTDYEKTMIMKPGTRPPGVQVASITKRPGGYVLAHVEGALQPTVNGNPVVGETVHLKNGDVIELAGTQMQFVQA